MNTMTMSENVQVRAADPTTGFRRAAGAIALPLGFVCHLVCNVIYAWVSTESGLTDTEDLPQAYALYAAYPTPLVVCTFLVIVGGLLLIPGLLTALRIVRPARPRLGLTAVVLMLVGYISYLGISFTNFDTVTFATSVPEVASVVESSPWQAAPMPFFVLFLIGNLIGTLLFGLAVVLGGRKVGVPWWAGALIMCWTLGHIINIAGGGEWFAVGGGALQIAGCVVLCVRALRMPQTQWARLG
ncbi:hypothetical protein [Microbacterium soli]|uniref:Integral membrane protein n=1 Tax=Microbacterium soli TaxID=446075 RepID=A0ABP7MN39_9MICO